MLSIWDRVQAFTQAALMGMGDPVLIVAALVLTTFLFEDVAIGAAAVLIAQEAIDPVLAFAAVAGGIAIGDLGLYGLGLLATRVPFLRRRLIDKKLQDASALLGRRLFSAVMLARVVPGLRLVTYVASGFLGISFARFSALVTLAVCLWTAVIFYLSVTVGEALEARFGIPAALAAALVIVVLSLIPIVVRLVSGHRAKPA